MRPAAIVLSAAIVFSGVALASSELQNLGVSSAVTYVAGMIGLMILWRFALALEAGLKKETEQRESDRDANRTLVRRELDGIIRKERDRARRAAQAERDRGRFGVRLYGSESPIPTPVVAEPPGVPPAA